MNMLVLDFDCNGVGRCLYSELIDLRSLGTLSTKRATAIEFNNTSQLWEVWSEQGERLYVSPSRANCLNWESTSLDSEMEVKKQRRTEMSDYTLIIYSLPDGEALVEWQEAQTPASAVNTLLKLRSLRVTEAEIIAVFPGKLRCEQVEGYKLFPIG